MRKIRRTYLFAETSIVFSAMGVHRDAEFTKNHAPSFALGTSPEQWLCVYRSCAPTSGTCSTAPNAARCCATTACWAATSAGQANTVASFALGDWNGSWAWRRRT